MRDYTNTEMFNLIDEWIHNWRDRRIMKDWLINGHGFEYLAERYDMSVSQVKRVVDKNMEIVQQYLN